MGTLVRVRPGRRWASASSRTALRPQLGSVSDVWYTVYGCSTLPTYGGGGNMTAAFMSAATAAFAGCCATDRSISSCVALLGCS